MTEIANTNKPIIIRLSQWNKHYPYPSLGTMRNLIARREENNASEFLNMINGRFYINVEKFQKWLESQPTLRRT